MRGRVSDIIAVISTNEISRKRSDNTSSRLEARIREKLKKKYFEESVPQQTKTPKINALKVEKKSFFTEELKP